MICKTPLKFSTLSAGSIALVLSLSSCQSTPKVESTGTIDETNPAGETSVRNNEDLKEHQAQDPTAKPPVDRPTPTKAAPKRKHPVKK